MGLQELIQRSTAVFESLMVTKEEINRLLWNLKIYYHVHNSPYPKSDEYSSHPYNLLL
jgi:hypothetical protein